MGRMGASGGLPKSKLEQATAVPGDVVAGKTFYAGDKELQTGLIPNYGHEPLASKCGIYNPGNEDRLYLYLPNADTDTENQGGFLTRSICTPIYQVASVAMKYGNTIYNHLHTGDNWTETKYWNVKKGEVYVIVALGFAQDSNIGNGQSSINTPNCTNLFNVDVNVTASTGYANRPLKVRCVRVDANTQISGYVRCGAGFAATYLGCFRIL